MTHSHFSSFRFAVSIGWALWFSPPCAAEDAGNGQQGRPTLYASARRAFHAQVFSRGDFLSFKCYPQETAKQSKIFRISLKRGKGLVVDLGEPRKINYLETRKHFWPFRTPMDLELDAYAGPSHDIKTVFTSDDWKTVAHIRKDLDHNTKVFKFPGIEARFFRIRVLKCVNKDSLADFCAITAGWLQPVKISGVQVKARPGENVLSWNQVASGQAGASSTVKGDVVSWNYSEQEPFYRVLRSSNPKDGFRVLNLEGEITEPRYVDDAVIPGMTYTYKVAVYRQGIKHGVSEPVSVVAKAGDRGPVEEGLWKVSAGRFGLDDGVYYSDEIESHGNYGGFTYGIRNRELFLAYPTLASRRPRPADLDFEGNRQAKNLRGCVVLGRVGLPAVAGEKPRYEVQYSGWDSLIYKSVYSRGRELITFMNGLMPALTVQTREARLALFAGRKELGIPAPAWVAFSENGAAATRPLEGPVSLRNMDQSWLLFWWGDGALTSQGPVDMPCLVILSARADSIDAGEDGLELHFDGPARQVSLMPLYGVTKKSTKGWERSFPAEAQTRAARWARRLKRIPIKCRDQFEVREKENRIKVELRYEYLSAEDDWQTRMVILAPVPPSTSLARKNGYPIQYESDVRTQNFDGTYGPLQAAENTERVIYDLPARTDAILDGPKREILHPELLPEVKRVLNPEPQISTARKLPFTPARWRPRNIDLTLQPYLTVYPILSDKGKEEVGAFCRDFLTRNRYFDLTTYGARRDRYSGRKYLISNDPFCRFSNTVDYAFGTGGALWTLYRYAETLGRWDEIRAHWDSIMQYGTVFEAGNGWGRQAPDAMTFYSEWGGNPDYLMSYLQGHLALARMANRVGDVKTYRRSVYLFSRTLLTYCNFWHIQDWVTAHLPHFSLKGKNHAPERGFTYAADIRGDGVISAFVNSKTENINSVYYPFVRACPDVAIFWDLYLRNTIAKYIYHDLPLISPEGIEGHVILARAFLFEKEPDRIYKWIDHAYLRNGDWGNVNNYALLLSMVKAPPVPVKPPPAKWVNAAYERRIAGEEKPAERLDFESVKLPSSAMEKFRAIWQIGQRDNSGKEFSQQTLSPAELRKYALEKNPELDARSLRTLIKKEPDFFDSLVSKFDRQVYVIGRSKPADWCYIQQSAWLVQGGGMARKGRHHPRTIAFDLPDPAADQPYHFVVDIHRLESFYPLFMTVDVNGHRQAVRCPLPPYAIYRLANQMFWLKPEDGETILSFPVRPGWLRPGQNRIILHVEGTCRVYYDWLGFGRFETGIP